MYEWASGLAASLNDVFASSLQSGSPVAYVLALLGGILASLTPCVLPMAPVTVTIIGGYAGGNRARALVLSLLFALGIGLNCGLVGAIAGSAGASLGKLAAHYLVRLGVGAVCVLFALAMFDRFSIPMPGFLQGLQSRQRLRSGYLGVFLSGFAFAFLAYACLAPVVGTIALVLFRGGRVLEGGLAMFCFGLGVGFPFVLLGTFTGLITAVMQRGSAMEKVKHAFGWAMLVLAGVFVFQAGEQRAKDLAAAAVAVRPPPPAVAPATATPDIVSLAGLPTISLDAKTSAGSAEVGQPACSFTWSDPTTGEVRALGDLLDTPVWLTFWADWCHNCPEEVPLMNALSTRYAGRLRVIGINEGDAPAVAQAWMAKHGVRYDVLRDAEETVAKDGFGLTGIPYNILIDRNGIIRFSSAGLPRDADRVINEVLGESR
ncbi:MAG TPA: cytochrome c biogenesis protein CcdA [Armatimonadota bacterium]|nr:cytochrome c biogenesis protein CcdA [Armatimonadota bacterium]